MANRRILARLISAAGKPLAALAFTTAVVALALVALGASPWATFIALASGAFGNWLAATACGIHLAHWPRPLAIAALLGVGAIAGAAWGALSGWLRARYQVSDV